LLQGVLLDAIWLSRAVSGPLSSLTFAQIGATNGATTCAKKHLAVRLVRAAALRAREALQPSIGRGYTEFAPAQPGHRNTQRRVKTPPRRALTSIRAATTPAVAEARTRPERSDGFRPRQPLPRVMVARREQSGCDPGGRTAPRKDSARRERRAYLLLELAREQRQVEWLWQPSPVGAPLPGEPDRGLEESLHPQRRADLDAAPATSVLRLFQNRIVL